MRRARMPHIYIFHMKYLLFSEFLQNQKLFEK